MFKKLKDKLAEEVKSSPQRIQQFAQAAQAAVTSASSSISDITNSDLFSIGDNETQPTKSEASSSSQQSTFQDASLLQVSQPLELPSDHNTSESQRQRRLSNSSFASDISFRLPSYETPSMYHLQSDADISASEAEERGLSAASVSLDRVTKEQLYGAYRRTQERYKKYRTQYGDLARHYKLLERENAKARNVLVETQDKALRRISELREQCSLEQSAKAHLENALRIEIEEKNMKIEALNSQVKLLQSSMLENNDNNVHFNNQRKTTTVTTSEDDVELINLSVDIDTKFKNEESYTAEVIPLNNKIAKMEQLLIKYKESLKNSKEKKSQLSSELQVLSNELENKNKEISQMTLLVDELKNEKQKNEELKNNNEELQNKVNAFEFTKSKEISTLQIDLQKALEEISQLRSKIEIFSKREEEYAISLAENKLSIHKELESKEAEIKSLNNSLTTSKKEVQSLTIIINDYKNNLSILENEKLKLINELNELNMYKTRVNELDAQLQDITNKCQSLEYSKTKLDEEYKCLQLQLKQETAEKLAMIDRNTYLENRNKQLTDDNTKKGLQISTIESDVQNYKNIKESCEVLKVEKNTILEELAMWKNKHEQLELEVQEERDELVTLQSEIEKLISNHELIQCQNSQYHSNIAELTAENGKLQAQLLNMYKMKDLYKTVAQGLEQVKQFINLLSKEYKEFQISHYDMLNKVKKQIDTKLNLYLQNEIGLIKSKHKDLKARHYTLQEELAEQYVISNTSINSLKEENNCLKSKNKKYESELNALKDNIVVIQQEYSDNLESNNEINRQNKLLKYTVQKQEQEITQLKHMMDEKKTNKTDINKLEDEKKKLTKEYLKIENLTIEWQEKIVNLESEKESLRNQLQNLEKCKVSMEEDVNNLKIENKNLSRKMFDLENSLSQKDKNNIENEAILSKLLLLEETNLSQSEEIKKLHSEKQDISNKLTEAEAFITTLQLKFNNCEEQCEKLSTELLNLVKTNTTLQEKINEVESEKEIMSRKLLDIESFTNTLEINLKTKQSEIATLLEDINGIKKENIDLVNLSQELHGKLMLIPTLEESNKLLSEENILCKNQLENILCKVKDLEQELNNMRKSYEEIQTGKDHLNKIIETLQNHETSDKSCITDSKYTQTDINTNKLNENVSDMDNLGDSNNKNIEETNYVSKYNALNKDYNLLKEENKRLQFDIEGLQTYLTKISKENSVLNDKLRELIATSENSTEHSNNHTLSSVIKEVETNKEKIENLLRENSLLVEENLELKDQLLNQNYSSNEKESSDVMNPELSELKVKYNILHQKSSKSEDRLLELDQLNKSITVNLTQVQEKNDKLSLLNEKLERRLDEALVSLRHLHSLQENTELEYLRNILYEYLTGSGTHSLTLAKVLAAIVKFDDSQTQLVLQKEKERQGLLRQLGLL